MIERFEKFSRAILDISHHWHKLTSAEMAKFGLRGPHSVYLLTLYCHPDGLTAGELCQKCGKDKSDVSRMLTIMEDKGYVIKEGNRSLYRGRYRLTELGVQVAVAVRSRTAAAVEYAGKDMSDDIRSLFYEALESVAVNLAELSEQGIPDAE